MAKKTAATINNLSDLIPDDRNANRGTERGSGFIETSLRSYGAGRSVLADKHGRLIAGNKTVEGCVNAGLDRIRVIQTDGTELVVVQRTDLDMQTDKAARELAIADNRAGQISLEWDRTALESLSADFGIDLNDVGFAEGELDKLAKGDAVEVEDDEVPSRGASRANFGNLATTGCSAGIRPTPSTLTSYSAARCRSSWSPTRPTEWNTTRSGGTMRRKPVPVRWEHPAGGLWGR
jgi:hypothetical protein